MGSDFDATLNMDEPNVFGDEAIAEFKRIGNELGERLRQELGPDFAVKVKV